MSSQQLQNLTSLSWQNSETVPADGGSTEKLVYIQKYEQFLGPDVKIEDTVYETRQQVASIMGLEVTGYEIDDTKGKCATEAKPAASDKSSDEGKTDQEPAAPPAEPK